MLESIGTGATVQTRNTNQRVLIPALGLGWQHLGRLCLQLITLKMCGYQQMQRELLLSNFVCNWLNCSAVYKRSGYWVMR